MNGPNRRLIGRVRNWLLVPDGQLSRRHRLGLAAVRGVLGAAVVKCLVLALVPLLLSRAAQEGSAGDVGTWALIVLCFLLPFAVLPYAIFQTGGCYVTSDPELGEALTVYTLRDKRVLPLGAVDRVTVWSLDSRGAWAKLSGPGLRPVWLNWSAFGFGTSERIEALVRSVASREGVTTNASARAVFELPGAPAGWKVGALWVRDFGVILLAGFAVAAVAVAYSDVLFGLSPWADLP